VPLKPKAMAHLQALRFDLQKLLQRREPLVA
jgi:hypothetical protein